MRTAGEWRTICKEISAGYIPSKGNTFDSGIRLVKVLQAKFNLFTSRNLEICDVGSGNGRLPMGLIGTQLLPKSYVGLEIIPACVSFCNKAFKDYDNFTFKPLDASNPRYWPVARSPELVEYPLEDESINLIIASSLFSHTGTIGVAQRNLDEMFRILKPGGLLYSSWIIRDKRDPNPAMTKYLLSDVERMLPNIIKVVSMATKSIEQSIEQDRQTGFLCRKLILAK